MAECPCGSVAEATGRPQTQSELKPPEILVVFSAGIKLDIIKLGAWVGLEEHPLLSKLEAATGPSRTAKWKIFQTIFARFAFR